jgi:hypothetical protein
MLKKRIVVAAISLGLCLPALSSATPLSWARPDLLASINRLWSLLPGAHHGPAAPVARAHRKNGPGMDPTGGTPAPPPSGGAQAVTPPDPTTGQ